jgi:hypothetical protein
MGKKSKKPKKANTVMITVRLSAEQRDKLNRTAEALNLSVNKVIVSFVDRWTESKLATLPETPRSSLLGNGKASTPEPEVLSE